jgi:methylglyoxal synthase
VLACTILTFALCADPRVSGAITLGNLSVPIVWSHANVPSCAAIGLQATGEAGLTQIETSWRTEQSRMDGATMGSRLVAGIASAQIDMTAYTWKPMSAADVAVLRAAYRATLWHEIGHLRTAEASLDAINDESTFTATTSAEFAALAKARADAGMARFRADQEAYDAAAEHGLRQDTLSPPLGGPDTILECPSDGR